MEQQLDQSDLFTVLERAWHSPLPRPVRRARSGDRHSRVASPARRAAQAGDGPRPRVGGRAPGRADGELEPMSRHASAQADRAPEVAPEIRHLVPWRVTSVATLPGFRLGVTFVDGTSGEVELQDFLERPGTPSAAASATTSAALPTSSSTLAHPIARRCSSESAAPNASSIRSATPDDECSLGVMVSSGDRMQSIGRDRQTTLVSPDPPVQDHRLQSPTSIFDERRTPADLKAPAALRARRDPPASDAARWPRARRAPPSSPGSA